MSQPIFFTSNPTRKKEYAIETLIYQDKKKNFSVKRPLHPEANSHTLKMTQHYKTLKSLKGLPPYLRIAKPQTNGTDITFEYIEGKSLDRLVLEKILVDKKSEALEALKNMKNLIESLPGDMTDPAANTQFISFFGSSYSGKQSCTNIGLLDLNLDNIIVDGSGWVLFDYEWLFDFPLPKNYLFERILYHFIIRHKQIFLFHARRLNGVEIAPDLFVPDYIYSTFAESFKKFNAVESSEMAFQSAVMQYHNRNSINFFPAKRIVSKTASDYKKPDGIYLLLERYVEPIRSQVKEYKIKSHKLEAELRQLKDSRSFRLSRRISSLYSLLKK